MLSPARRILKMFHPEGIPWPGSVIYNMVSSSEVFQRHYQLIAEDILNYCSEGRMLDIGTGPGWILEKLHQATPNIELVGLDISPSMIAKAKKNMADLGLANKIQIEQGDVRKIPFQDSSFDVVLSTGSLHHWKKPLEGIDEIYRVLKPGGHALLYDIVSDTPKSVMQKAKEEFGNLKMFLLWLHAFEEPFYSHAKFELLAESTHFKEGDTKFVGVMCCMILTK